MNVAVFGRVRPPIRSEPTLPSLYVTDENTLSSSQQKGAVSHRFQTLYDHNASNEAIYQDIILPMLDLLVAGFNCSLLCFGESGSGKTHSLTGEETTGTSNGFIHMAIKDLFDKTSMGYGASTSTAYTNSQIDLSMHELSSETIRDLLKTGQNSEVSRSAEEHLTLGISAEQGLHIKNLTSVRVASETDALNALRSGLSSRNTSQTDYGPAQTRATVFVKLTLTVDRQQAYGYPHQSTFTFVDLPAAEKLTEDPQTLRKKEGMLLNKSLLSLRPLIEELANKREPNRIIQYSESQLTKQLSDILGGNCKTKVFLHFKPQTRETVLDVMLTIARQVSQISIYPVANDVATRGLITQYRAKILYLKRQLGQTNVEPTLTSEELQENHTKLARENLTLKEAKRYLQRKLEELQDRFEDNAGAKSDLSSKLIACEEDRLKASKTLVDLKIENARLKEKTAQQTFELNNKLMSLDTDYSHVEIERSCLAKENMQMRQKLGYLETDKKDVTDKYVHLKADYRALIRKYDQEVNRNQELGLELLNLLHARVTLLKQQDNLVRANTSGSIPVKPSNEELGRLRDIAIGMSNQKIKAEDIGSTEMERLEVEHKIFGNHDRFRREIDSLRNQYDVQQEQLKARITNLTTSVKNSMETARSAQHKLAEQDVDVIMLREKVKSLQTANGHLQLQLKEKNEELRSKLTKYLQDIAEYVDARTNTFSRPVEQYLTEYVKDKVKDLKATYVSREKQLSDAAREYRSQAHRVSKIHEQLMVAYRLLKIQQGQQQWSPNGNNLKTADEFQFSLSDKDLESANQQEISRLAKELREAEQQIARLKMPGAMNTATGGWKALEKQLQEFTRNTQQELENERATLMSTNVILEEQLTECRRYIDTHLTEYKAEISRLRKQLSLNPSNGQKESVPKREHWYRGRPSHKATHYE